MSGYHIVVCAGIVPDPLQTLEPLPDPAKPALKNEAMLPAVLDPWGAHALYEAAALAREVAGTKVWLASVAPKARLQQVMMSVAQKASCELLPVDGPAGGFTDAFDIAAALAASIQAVTGLDRSRLLVFGGWESASRCGGTTLQMVGERLGIVDQFLGVDRLTVGGDGRLEILERIEGARHQVSICEGPPLVVGWATGSRPEPPNSPQVGMANMRQMMPALQRAAPLPCGGGDLTFSRVALPGQRRQTVVVKDVSPEAIALDIVEWIQG